MKTPNRALRASRPRGIAILSLLLAPAFVISAVAGGSSAMAVWSARVTASGSVSAGSLSVAFAGVVPTTTFINSSLSSTASVSVSNTTSSASAPDAELELTVSGPATSPLAAVTNVVVWTASSPSECDDAAAPGGDAVAGNWANSVTLTSAALAPGSTQNYCVRSSVATRQAAASGSGAQSFQAQLAARLVLHSFSVSATSVSDVTSAWIFPFSTLSSSWYNFMPSGQAACVDVSAGPNAPPGSAIGTYVCFGSGTDFQMFTLDPLAGTLVAIRTAVSNFNMAADPGGAVIVQVNDPSSPAQRWEPQLVSPGVFQFVNDSNGLCLTAPASFGPLSVSACDGSPGQAFTAIPG